MGNVYISEEEYCQSEELSLEKHEWCEGRVFSFGGWVRAKQENANNRPILLANLLKTTRNALLSNLFVVQKVQERVQIQAVDDSTLLTPKVIFEVLSESTPLRIRYAKMP